MNGFEALLPERICNCKVFLHTIAYNAGKRRCQKPSPYYRNSLIGYYRADTIDDDQVSKTDKSMRVSLAALVAANMIWGGAVSADDTSTVIELYTSQGCSSCPPADEMLAELADRDDVIALSLHVDYWDYIGWVDDLADPDHTKRQQNFAHAAGSRAIYTPQMVIGGVDHVIGSRPMEVMDLLNAHSSTANPVDVSLQRDGDRLSIIATANQDAIAGSALVQIVRYAPEVTRDIKRGENAGRTITYANVVTDWQVGGLWDVAQPLEMQANVPGDDAVAVIIQDGSDGPVIGAAQLR